VDADELARLVGEGWATDRDGGAMPDRLALALRHLIDGDLLAPGVRLPPERALAAAFHVSRPTMTAALDELRQQGLVASRQGSGTWVGERPRGAVRPRAMSEAVLVGHGINLAAAAPPDSSLLTGPRDSELLATVPAHGLGPEGLPELRAALAAWHTAHRLPTSADDLMVTSGAHHALGLVLGAFCAPGDRVIVEEHTYGGLLDLLAVAHVSAVAVPRDARGVDVAALTRAIDRTRPRLVCLMPSVHAPTGAGTGVLRRRELAAALDRAGALVVVDETLAETADPVPSLAALCSVAEVVSVHSFSKTAWAGLRVGWIRARPQARERLARHRARVDLGTSVPGQHAALRIATGMDAFLARRREDLRAKAIHLRDALGVALPEWRIALPYGGLSLWARLPVEDAAGYVRAAEAAGVVVMHGAVARADRGPDPHVRLCFDRGPQILDEAVVRLARAWDAMPAR